MDRPLLYELEGQDDLEMLTTRTQSKKSRFTSLPYIIILSLLLMLLISQRIKNRRAEEGEVKVNLESAKFQDLIHKHPANSSQLITSVTQPEANHLVTAILLHGNGKTGESLHFVSSFSRRFPFIKWVTPHFESPARSWYETERGRRGEDEKGILRSAQQISSLIRQERESLTEAGIDALNILLLGEAEGGSLSLLAALSQRTPLIGCVSMGGSLLLSGKMNYLSDSNFKNIPIYLAASWSDKDRPMAHSRSDSQTIRQGPLAMEDVEFNEYESFNGTVAMKDLGEWMETLFMMSSPGNEKSIETTEGNDFTF